MALSFEKPYVLRQFTHVLRGFDGQLTLAVTLLAMAGLITMFASGYANGMRFWDHARNLGLAFCIMFVVAQIPPQRLMTFAVPIYTVGLALLVAVALFGLTKNGARRWLNIGIVIQPSEIMKIGLPLMLAWWFQKREGQLRPLDFLAATVLLAMPVGLIARQPDMGTAILVFSAGVFVLYFAGLGWKWIIPPLLIGLVGVVLLVIFEPMLCVDDMKWPMFREY